MADSSRDTTAGAGWLQCGGPGSWLADVPSGSRPASWLRPGVLWQSRNDLIAKYLHDPTDRVRARWVALARERARQAGESEDFVIRRGGEDATSLLVFGDPGEGDASQYALVPALLSRAEGIDVAVICSDVIYPSGDSADYGEKFYRPYARVPAPILAVPGNHDWYDGLHGFMHHFCGLDAPDDGAAGGRGLRGLLARVLWRRSPRPSDAELQRMRGARADPRQPAPYLAIDAGPARIVLLDTGISGAIDPEQVAWLRRVSLADDRPKVLLTGKPIYVDGEHNAGPVDDLLRDPRANYVAAIGGDIHNYQRYPVALPDGRRIHYIVSGGGGAFMHATHQIPRVELPGVSEDDFRCYPLRGDSLARYSQLYDARLGRTGALALPPEEAATYMAGLLGLDPVRSGPRPRLSWTKRRIARLIQPAPATRGFHRWFSEAFDWNDPPMFKHFLRLDITPDALRIRCFGVTGCAAAEAQPPVEDEVTIAL